MYIITSKVQVNTDTTENFREHLTIQKWKFEILVAMSIKFVKCHPAYIPQKCPTALNYSMHSECTPPLCHLKEGTIYIYSPLPNCRGGINSISWIYEDEKVNFEVIFHKENEVNDKRKTVSLRVSS